MKQEARWRHFRHPDSSNAVCGDVLPTGDPELHHVISDAQRTPVDIFSFLWEHGRDPAIKVLIFLPSPFCC